MYESQPQQHLLSPTEKNAGVDSHFDLSKLYAALLPHEKTSLAAVASGVVEEPQVARGSQHVTWSGEVLSTQGSSLASSTAVVGRPPLPNPKPQSHDQKDHMTNNVKPSASPKKKSSPVKSTNGGGSTTDGHHKQSATSYLSRTESNLLLQVIAEQRSIIASLTASNEALKLRQNEVEKQMATVVEENEAAKKREQSILLSHAAEKEQLELRFLKQQETFLEKFFALSAAAPPVEKSNTTQPPPRCAEVKVQSANVASTLAPNLPSSSYQSQQQQQQQPLQIVALLQPSNFQHPHTQHDFHQYYHLHNQHAASSTFSEGSSLAMHAYEARPAMEHDSRHASYQNQHSMSHHGLHFTPAQSVPHMQQSGNHVAEATRLPQNPLWELRHAAAGRTTASAAISEPTLMFSSAERANRASHLINRIYGLE